MERYKILKQQLAILGLDGVNENFLSKAEEIRKTGLDYIDYLAELINCQMQRKVERSVNYRIREAGFPEIKRVEEFDFKFQNSIRREEIDKLLDFEFVERKENIIFVGPPGVGKTHLAIGIGILACERRIRTLYIKAEELLEEMKIAKMRKRLGEYIEKLARYNLLIIDELGYMPLEEGDGNLFFQLVSRKYEKSSIIITTNRSFEEWGAIFKDEVIAAAILDRLLHHGVIFKITGKSYRLMEKKLDNGNKKG